MDDASPTDEAPKSAVELAMARLKSRDAAEGTVERSLSDTQKAAIAELRNVYGSRLAQAEILYKSGLETTLEPEERQKREEEYRRDVQRMNDERDRKIEVIRTRE